MVLIECVPVSFSFLFMVLVVLARLVFLSGLESALGYSLLSSASNCYSFVPTNSIQATSKKKKKPHFRFPLLILHISPRNFACHRQVQVTNACPNSVMSDLTSSKFKYKQNRKCTRSLASTAPQAHAPAEKKHH